MLCVESSLKHGMTEFKIKYNVFSCNLKILVNVCISIVAFSIHKGSFTSRVWPPWPVFVGIP